MAERDSMISNPQAGPLVDPAEYPAYQSGDSMTSLVNTLIVNRVQELFWELQRAISAVQKTGGMVPTRSDFELVTDVSIALANAVYEHRVTILAALSDSKAAILVKENEELRTLVRGLHEGRWLAYDNSNPPQLWVWDGDRDEAAEPVFRIPAKYASVLGPKAKEPA